MGDEVFCGTVNRFGSVDIRASRVGEDSSLQTLIRMVQQAEEKQAPTARVADRAASWLVPAALVIAVIAGLVTRDIVRAVTVLVVFCPCALVLATPTAIMAAIGQATKHGVIIKSGEALEKMGRADTVAFDKTGTLTCGQLTVSDTVPFAPDMSGEALRAQGKAVILTAQNGVCVGALALSDRLRPEAGRVVARLAEMQTDAVLLTGDNRAAAEHFARRVGVAQVRAELLPAEKVVLIAALLYDRKFE